MTTRDNRKALIKLASKHGFVLCREKKHFVFKHPSGAILVCSKSSANLHTLANIQASIKRILNKQ